MDIESRPHLVVFDPLRGFLAFWVYAYHLMRLTTAKGYGGAIAVDIFMFVSGFLMFYIWNVKGSVQLNPRTIAGFYVRRSFRIVCTSVFRVAGAGSVVWPCFIRSNTRA